MTTQHPITPPPELVEQWRRSGPADAAANNAYERHIATQAARWGADQELEACCKLLELSDYNAREFLTAARRPEPPSLKEQALEAMDRCDNEIWCEETERDLAIIRTALEQLND